MVAIKGIDISHWQGNPDFKRVKAAGVRYVMLKATEGVEYVDPCFKTNIAAAISAGLPVGAYHFLRSGDVTAQVRDFLAAIRPYQITWPAAVDVEHDELVSLGKDQLTTMVLNFCAQVKAAGYQPMVYSSRNWLFVAQYLDVGRIKAEGIPIWLAWYSSATPENTDRSTICDIWQYASDGKADGITSNGLDLNVSYRDFSVPRTVVQIDTTMDVEKPAGSVYTFRTVAGQTPAVTVGTGGVVSLMHCRREGNNDFWHLFFLGEPGAETGIYTAGPGEAPLIRFKARVK